MSESIIVALITGGLSLIGVILVNRRSTVELYAKLDKQSELSDAKLDREIAVMRTQIEELTRETRKHNNFGERIPVIEEQLRDVKTRVTDLENDKRRAS